MEKTAELLSQPINYAVVQLPERRFPGVVIQGDALHELVRDLQIMIRMLESGNLEDLAIEIESVHSQLSDALVHYERICSAKNIELPYSK